MSFTDSGDIFVSDVTGVHHNVMVEEVGYALEHIDTGRMVFYFRETENCKTVPFTMPFDVNQLMILPK